MAVELCELELRPCALVDDVGFGWTSRGWVAPSREFSAKLWHEGAEMSDEEFRREFPEADLSTLPRSAKSDPAAAAE